MLSSRVQAVGGDRFGIVAVDCAKSCSKFLFVNFYSQPLILPTVVEHGAGQLRAAVEQIRAAAARHRIADLVVAIERTGDYHRLVKQAFNAAGFETRIVHPFTSKQMRLPADSTNKTDDTDLAAIVRAAVVGLGLFEPEWDSLYRVIQLIVRQRRDLVEKRSALLCQAREKLHAYMPGFAEAFLDLFAVPAALFVAREYDSADALRRAGPAALSGRLREARIAFRSPTIAKCLAWAGNAPAPHQDAPILRRLFAALDEDRKAKSSVIDSAEAELVGLVARTPYILLLSMPGINVVSAAECAGEIGPICNYAGHRNLTGRSGLFPSRHQSDQTDHPDGPLVANRNRRLRAALVFIADNLVACNNHFRALGDKWKLKGVDPRAIRVRVADRFCRIAFQMVAGRQVFRHPSCKGRDYVLEKLHRFCNQHGLAPRLRLTPMLDAAEHLPKAERSVEAARLAAIGVKRLGDLLPAVLAKLGVPQIQSPVGQEPG